MWALPTLLYHRIIHLMSILIHKAWAFLSEIIFPRFCFGCSKRGRYLCDACRRDVLETEINYPKNSDFALTSGSYRHPAMKKALRKLKYDSASDVAGELAAILAKDLVPYLKYAQTPIITAIPMTEKRRRTRGFNQAELLAEHLAKNLALEYRATLIKIRETLPQAEIKNRKDRFKNIKGAFALKEKSSAPEFAVIVDDIITTGATMNEAAVVLKKSGVKKIICVAVAR